MTRVVIHDPVKAIRSEDDGSQSPTEDQEGMEHAEPCAQQVNAKRECRLSVFLRGTLVGTPIQRTARRILQYPIQVYICRPLPSSSNTANLPRW